MALTRVYSIIGTLSIWSVAGCGDPGVTGSALVPVCGTGAGTNASGAGGAAPSGAGGVGGVAGGAAAPGPCPAGYMCVDLSSLGATATDGAGSPITASCGNGAPTASCDDANPAATCAGLPNPLCAHVSVAGMNIVSCGQRCTP